MSVPLTAKAVIQPSLGAKVLEATSLTLAPPGPTDYVIKMKASVPCKDELSWEAAFPDVFSARVDRVPGTEGAGVVVKAPSPAEFKPGDEVMFRLDAWLTGTLREYTNVPAANVARKPKTLSWSEASATPLSSLTAWQALFEHGILDVAGIDSDAASAQNRGRRVLVTGASGSVGQWALRFGSAAGATMIGVGSGAKADEIRAAGANEVVDYKVPAAQWGIEEVDQVFDCTGKDLGNIWQLLKNGGRFLSVAADPTASKPENKTADTAKWFLVQPRGTDLARISDLVDKNGWHPLIDSVVPFDQFQAAYDKTDSGRTTGKVVITVSE